MDAGLRLSITGVVQGVGFRYFVLRTAQQLDITGWVQNETNGSVTAEVFGTVGALKELIASLRVGNRLSTVKGIHEQPIPPDPEMKTFEIRR